MKWILYTEFRRSNRVIMGVFLIIYSVLLIFALRGNSDIYLVLNDLVTTSFLFFPIVVFTKLMLDFYSPKYKLYQLSSIKKTTTMYANLLFWVMTFTIYFVIMILSLNLLFQLTNATPLWAEGYGYKELLLIGKRNSEWWGIFQCYFQTVYLITLSIMFAYLVDVAIKKWMMIYGGIIFMYIMHGFIRWIVFSINNRFIFMNYNRVNSFYPIMYLDNEINHMSLFGIILPIMYLCVLLIVTAWRVHHEN